MSIFVELRNAATEAFYKGDHQRVAALDQCTTLLGSANREWQMSMDREAFRILHTIVTEALVLLGDKPRLVA